MKLRSKHVRLRKSLTPAQIKEHMEWRNKLPKSMADLQRQEEEERALIDGAELPPPVDVLDVIRNAAPALDPAQAGPPPVVPTPQGYNRDHWASILRAQELPERINNPRICADLDLPDDAAATYKKLIALSQPRPRAKGDAIAWRAVSISELAADVRLVLDQEPLEEPIAGWNQTTHRMPLPTAEERIEASRRLERDLELLEQRQLIRWVARPAWAEVSLAGV